MSAALGLYRLQQIDSQLDQAQVRLETIRQTLENDVELREACERAASAEAEQREAEKSLHMAEAEVQSQRIKLEQAEASLYGGAVHNPKELQDLQKDVASLKKHLATLEDRQLEAMLTGESTASALTEARSALARVESRLGDQNKNLAGERTNLTHTLERFESERKAALSPLNPRSVETYESLRHDRRGLAVTTITDGSCDACGTTLTPAQQQIARSSGQVTNCPTCGRFLFSE
jgi:hypothetical protein